MSKSKRRYQLTTEPLAKIDVLGQAIGTSVIYRWDTLVNTQKQPYLDGGIPDNLAQMGAEFASGEFVAVLGSAATVGKSTNVVGEGLGNFFGNSSVETKVVQEAADTAKVAQGTLTRTQINQLVNDIGGSIKSNPLRQEYENAVTGLKNMETELRSQGASEESIAQTLYQARRDLGVTYKDATPAELRQYIYEVNANRYGDNLGPTFDSLVEKYKGDYSKIIEAAQRPNSDVDSLLGGFKEWLLKKNGQ